MSQPEELHVESKPPEPGEVHEHHDDAEHHEHHDGEQDHHTDQDHNTDLDHKEHHDDEHHDHKEDHDPKEEHHDHDHDHDHDQDHDHGHEEHHDHDHDHDYDPKNKEEHYEHDHDHDQDHEEPRRERKSVHDQHEDHQEPRRERTSVHEDQQKPRRERTSVHEDHQEPRRERKIRYDTERDSERSEYRPTKEPFEYETYVELAGEGASFATAAQLATLEKRNKVLMEAIEKLEDKLYGSEDQRMAVQRRLLIAEEESADYHTLIDQRESHNVQIRKELDQLGVKLQNETSRFNEVDNERRKLDHKAALVAGEVEVNARAQAKLEQTLAEIENLRHKLSSMINEKGELDQQVTHRQKEVSELEKRLHSEALRSREINNRTVTNLEGVIESERKRAQQAIDYVRQTLKAKIRVLEAQVETDRESDTKIKKEKREVARELKQVMRKLDEKKSEVGRDKRRIETLEKQVESLKDRLDQISIETSNLERKHHSLKREVGTLAANAKLNVLIPSQAHTAIEEEEAASKYEKPDVSGGHESLAKNANLFDTSVSLDTDTDIPRGTAHAESVSLDHDITTDTDIPKGTANAVL